MDDCLSISMEKTVNDVIGAVEMILSSLTLKSLNSIKRISIRMRYA